MAFVVTGRGRAHGTDVVRTALLLCAGGSEWQGARGM